MITVEVKDKGQAKIVLDKFKMLGIDEIKEYPAVLYIDIESRFWMYDKLEKCNRAYFPFNKFTRIFKDRNYD
jgi:hypothetical protein